MAFGRGKKEKAKNLLETGSKAIGVVLNVRDTGITINELDLRVNVTFRIEPLDGSGPFEAAKTTTVSRAAIPHAGDRFPVWYDATDPENWMYAVIDDEQGREQIRQLFGDKAATLTGIGDPSQPVAAAPDPLDRLQKLNELRAAGAVTDAEFESKKAELLAEI
jgi:hypothetical protein